MHRVSSVPLPTANARSGVPGGTKALSSSTCLQQALYKMQYNRKALPGNSIPWRLDRPSRMAPDGREVLCLRRGWGYGTDARAHSLTYQAPAASLPHLTARFAGYGAQCRACHATVGSTASAARSAGHPAGSTPAPQPDPRGPLRALLPCRRCPAPTPTANCSRRSVALEQRSSGCAAAGLGLRVRPQKASRTLRTGMATEAAAPVVLAVRRLCNLATAECKVARL